jgi:uncharacterized protein (DUF983 family)
MKPDLETLRQGLRCVCPQCNKGKLYQDGFSMELRAACEERGLNFSKSDAADGPAVFLIFILGALIVPIAIAFEFAFSPQLWLHALVWGSLVIGLTIGMLRPIKSYVIALQYKHRPDMFK